MFGSILGSCLAELNGLNAVYLPEGVSVAVAREIVERANRGKDLGQTYAILVTPNGDSGGMSSSEALKYRQGRRLAVVVGRHPDLGSFESFDEILGLNYPDSAQKIASLQDVASHAVDEILAKASIDDSLAINSGKTTAILTECFSRAMAIHQNLREGTESWNAYWFTHMDEALHQMASLLQHLAPTGMLIDDFFQEYTHACFGFSRPRSEVSKRPSTKALVEAYKTYWSDQSTIQNTVQYLEHHPERVHAGRHPMEEVDWDSFDQTMAATDNLCIAFVRYSKSSPTLLEAFRVLTDEQFVNPMQSLDNEKQLTPTDAEGRHLGTGDEADPRGPYVVKSQVDVTGQWQDSEQLRVMIPTLARVLETETTGSSAQLVTKTAKTSWAGKLETDENGDLWAVGSIRREIGKTKAGPKPDPKRVKLEVFVPSNDQLSGRISDKASLEVHLVSPEHSGMWAIPVRKSTSLGRPDFSAFGPGSDENGGLAISLESTAMRYRYVVWAADLASPPQLEGQDLQLLHGRSDLYVGEEIPSPLSILEIGEHRFECRALESSQTSHSPIAAAILKTRPTRDPLDAETEQSLRGVYEAYAARGINDDGFVWALGHLVVPADRPMSLLPTENSAPAGILMSEEFSEIWAKVSDFSVPQNLIQSVAASEFRDALRNLDIAGRLGTRQLDEETVFTTIPSKTSWRDLWESDKSSLERYLNAYSELVSEARRLGNAAGLFWATYPLSISIWKTEDTATLSAVLLSPLHPLRLAWLAGVESTLWNSTLSEELAGTVEGWKFPLIGPPASEGGHLVAVPLEAGQDQVFLGWSMLVRASIEEARPLTAPERAGNAAVPGTAVSGLNATAVSAALRSYRQMNPHISTMTIDLAATTQTNRLHEVDEAVLEEVYRWTTQSRQSLIGGARIWDSTKRVGEPPRELMSRLIRSTDGVPLTWARYAPDSADMKPCNIRILQDAGVRVKVASKTKAPRLGAIGRVPLRRFEAPASVLVQSQSSVSSPTFVEELGWEPFTRAVLECERGTGGTAIISTKLFHAAVVNDTADWTVSGESLMSPSAIASSVQNVNGATRMLWEWRPPFLDAAKGIPALERRPFVSIARIPHGFKAQLRSLLSRARGYEADDEQVERLLGKLGARGVGLSAMLSMGGTHAAGALGFFLVFALMEQQQNQNGSTYVLPVDACDSFLRALAGGAKAAETMRRADILLLKIEENAITLSPIEIKFYGLASEFPQGNLPAESDAALNEPLEQVRTTAALLEAVAETWSRIASFNETADKQLWANGITALAEAAVRLQPDASENSEILAKSLGNLADGKSAIRIGQPIIAFFKHGAKTNDGSPYRVSLGIETPGSSASQFGLLSANSSAAFQAVEDTESDLVRDWNSMVKWAHDDAYLTIPPVLKDYSWNEDESNQTGNENRPNTQPECSPDNIDHTPPEKQLDEASQEKHPDDSLGNSRSGLALESSANKNPLFINGIRGEGVRFPVGQVLGATSERFATFWPGNTDLNQMNVGIVGDLGTGKTQLMKSLIYQLRLGASETQETPLSMLVFDYKRDFQEKDFLQAVGGQVLRVNNIPVNFFELREGFTPIAANQRTNEFIDVIDKIYGGIGPVQKYKLSQVIMDLYKEDQVQAPTIGRVLARYMQEDEKPDSVTSILSKFVNAEVFSEDQSSLVSFSEIMRNNVLVVALNDFGTDDAGKNALVVMFLNLYYDYMLNSQKWPFVGEKPQLRRLNSFLLVDEAVNIMKYKFPVLMNLLLQGREFGFGVMLASQYLSHFKKDQENYGEPLLTWFIHKVKNVTDKELQQVGLGGQNTNLAQRIANLGKHQSIYRSLEFDGYLIEDIPFFKLIAGKEIQ